YNLKDEVSPIILDDIDEYNEWLVGELGTTTFRDNDNDNMDNDADLVHEVTKGGPSGSKASKKKKAVMWKRKKNQTLKIQRILKMRKKRISLMILNQKMMREQRGTIIIVLIWIKLMRV
ncbi:hypothetical protein HN873_064041, partial [Arachis hypogaea]